MPVERDHAAAVAFLFRQKARLGGSRVEAPGREELPVGAPVPERVRYLLRRRTRLLRRA